MASAAAAQSRPTSSRREIIFVTLAVVVGGFVTFALLLARGATPQASGVEVDPSAVEGFGPVQPPLPAVLPTWNANRARWVGRAPNSVAFELPATNRRVQAWMKQVEPVLVVRCLANRTEAFVYTETAARIEPQADKTVAIAFDDEPQTTERWPDSADRDALFAPDGAAFARRLMEAETLRFGFTPHNAPPVTIHFNVAGLRQLLEPSARLCGWKKK